MISPEEFIKAKYNLEFTAGDDHIYIEYLEKELKEALEENIKLKKFKFFSDCFKALNFIQERFEDFQEEKKDEQAAQIEELKANNKGLAVHCNSWMAQVDKAREENRKLKNVIDNIHTNIYKNVDDEETMINNILCMILQLKENENY